MYFSWPSKSIRRDRSHYSSGPLGPYLLNCDSYKSLMSPHSMEGTIPTGPYHLDCDSCRSQISHSLRSKPFRLVSEQRKTSVLTAREIEREPKDEKRGRWGGGGGRRKETPAEKPPLPYLSSLPPPCCFTRAIFGAVFDSRSWFFAPKPHGNACYAG